MATPEGIASIRVTNSQEKSCPHQSGHAERIGNGYRHPIKGSASTTGVAVAVCTNVRPCLRLGSRLSVS